MDECYSVHKQGEYAILLKQDKTCVPCLNTRKATAVLQNPWGQLQIPKLKSLMSIHNPCTSCPILYIQSADFLCVSLVMVSLMTPDTFEGIYQPFRHFHFQNVSKCFKMFKRSSTQNLHCIFREQKVLCQTYVSQFFLCVNKVFPFIFNEHRFLKKF